MVGIPPTTTIARDSSKHRHESVFKWVHAIAAVCGEFGHPESTMTKSQSRVALVDDDDSVRTSLARLFRSSGMELLVFESGEDFLAADAVESVGCLIVDVRMPKMRGLELQKICVARWPSMQIIMMSAFNDDDAEKRAHRAGALAFLHKPFNATSLLSLVKDAIKSHGSGEPCPEPKS